MRRHKLERYYIIYAPSKTVEASLCFLKTDYLNYFGYQKILSEISFATLSGWNLFEHGFGIVMYFSKSSYVIEVVASSHFVPDKI